MNTGPRHGACKRIEKFLYIPSNAMISWTEPMYSKELEPYRFHVNNDNAYYMNGRKEIFLLSSGGWEGIYCGAGSRVFKRPNGEHVLFTPISHLEYVFS